MRCDSYPFEKPYFFLLESSLGGRYTIAAWDPVRVIEAKGGDGDFLEVLREELRRGPAVEAPGLPFAGGWIGYLGYELYSEIEKKVPPREPDLLPRAVFCFYDRFYIYDHNQKRSFFCHNTPSTLITRPELLPPLNVRGGPGGCYQSIESNFTKSQYLAAIGKIKDYIAAGDCYQVNLSQRFSCATSDDPWTIYQRLKAGSPAPYSAYLNLGNAQILSSSPESFLEVNGREVITRPIKGTRSRGETAEEDKKLREELKESVKDHAELLMITDLERNDLGRVCRAGSVTVPELCTLKSFAQVHHLVATIRGELAEGKDTVDLLRAAFPGGSITGAPKIRAMQIIRELEPHPRNVYCGAIGYLSLNGKAQFNVAIRTMVLKGGNAYLYAGGGIVADSDPESEYDETIVKAKGMVEALNPDRPDHLGHTLRLEQMGEEETGQEARHNEHIVDPDRVEVG